MRLLILAVWVIATTSATDEVQVTGGAIIEEVGSVNLIKDIVIVKKNFTEISYLKEKAMEMENLVKEMKEKEPEDSNKKVLENLKQILSEFTGTRKKRSLLPFVGNLMNTLFGVATENDLKREKERLNKIENWAENIGNLITSSVGTMNQHAKVINNLTQTLNIISERVEDKFNVLERRIMLQEIELKTQEIVYELKLKMEALINAHHGVVDVNLFELKELKETLEYSVMNFLLKPFEVDIMSYYSLMNVKVVGDQVFILLPFNNNYDMRMKKIIPFPMYIEEKTVMLKGERKIVLEKTNVDLVSIWEEKDLEQCVEFKEKEFICNHDMFLLYPITKFKCLNYLLNKGDEPCEYVGFEDDVKVELVKDKLYVYTKNEENIIIKCKGKEERMKVINVHIFPRECNLKMINVMYYEPTVFQIMQLNSTFKKENFKVNMKKIKLPKAMQVAEEYQWHNIGFFYVYKNKVMPLMTLVSYPMIVIICIVVFLFVRNKVIKKLKEMKTLLQERNEE